MGVMGTAWVPERFQEMQKCRWHKTVSRDGGRDQDALLGAWTMFQAEETTPARSSIRSELASLKCSEHHKASKWGGSTVVGVGACEEPDPLQGRPGGGLGARMCTWLAQV